MVPTLAFSSTARGVQLIYGGGGGGGVSLSVYLAEDDVERGAGKAPYDDGSDCVVEGFLHCGVSWEHVHVSMGGRCG
jgi:hypothetical protein